MADEKKKIEDFGEKIEGARKDLYTKKGKLNLEDIANWTEYERQNLATKTNIWERPNYQKLVDDGLTKRCAFFIKAIYDSIPTKAPDSYSYVYDTKGNDNIDIYTDAVSQLREICKLIKTDDDIRGFYSLLLTNFKHLDENRSGLFGSNTAGAFSTKLRRAISRYTSMYLLDLDIDAKKFLFSDDEKKLSKYDILKYNNNVSFDAAEDNRLAVSDIGTRYLYNQTEDFCRPENWENGKFFVMTNSYPYTIIGNNFETEEAAKAFALEYETELEKDPTTKSRKTKLTPPQLEHIERTGKDYRADKDIEGEDFLTEFAMRGGQFGEWLNQNDRQANLNMCFDSFKDLAAALGVDDKDVSLGGQLAIAFGARGHSSALAHYEPAQNVINLTKMRGAGTLAHEWGHALDFFIARQYGLKNSFMSESRLSTSSIHFQLNPTTADYNARLAFGDVMSAIKYDNNRSYTEYYKNARKLDAAHSKAGHGYWASEVELFARAFACYVMDKLAPEKSDYLCGHAEMGGGAACTYPTGEERKNINAAIDKLIEQLKIEEIFHERPVEIENVIEEKEPVYTNTIHFSINGDFYEAYGDEADKASLALRIKMDLNDGINKVVIPQADYDNAVKGLAEWGYKAEIVPSAPEAEKVSHNETTFAETENKDSKLVETPARNTRFTVDEVEKIQSDALRKFTASGENWAEYCKSAAYTYKYSFNETLIMASQMPNATAMAEFGVWSRRLGARINRGAKGVPVVIQDNNGNKKLEYLYDISQTNSKHKLWQPDLSRVSENSIRELVNTALDTNNNIKQMPLEYKDFAIESAMLIACTRCGIDYTAANLDAVSSIDRSQFPALADTINVASKTVLRDIERHFHAVEQEQQKEAEIDKPQAEKSNQTKDGREIIGNTAYAKIKRKNFNTYVTPTARAIAAELEKDGIQYSGVIDGNSTTITISFTDKSKLDEIAARVTEARKKDTPQKESNRISNELVEAAKRINIVDYLNSKGIQTKRVGSNEYTMLEHDSMRIKDSSYYWNSQNKGGNAVNFAMEVLGMEYRQALEDLLSFAGYTDFHNIGTVTPVQTEKQEQPQADEPHVVLPNELDNKTNRTFAYLTKTRGIPEDIVKSLIENGSIAQDMRGNAVFKIFDENGELTGAELTSTNTSHRFKQTTERGGNGFTINPTGADKPEKVIFFEAGIDTMSYYALHRDTNALLVSMGGLKDKVVNTTLDRYGIAPENALIATDNDEAGKNFAQKMQETLGIPAHQLTDDTIFELCGNDGCKDWNDLLKAYNEKREELHIDENTKGLSLDLLGNDGSWSVVDSFEENGKKLFELESDNYGFTDKVGHIVLTENGDYIKEISLAEKQAELSTAEKVSHDETTFNEQEISVPNKQIINLYKLGDFYEAFGEEAQIMVDVLELHSSLRNGEKMTGIPSFALDRFIDRLKENGYGVEIHDEPREAVKEPINDWDYTSNPVGDTMFYSVYRIKDKNEVDHSGNRDMAMSYIEDKALCIQIADALNNQGITDLEQAKAIAADMLNSSVQNAEKTDFEQALENVVGADKVGVITKAFNENTMHGWQGDQTKENRIKKAFYDILADDTLVEQAFDLFAQNTNMAEKTASYEAEKESHNENDFSDDKELSAVFDSYTEFYNKLYEQGNNAVEGYDLAVSIGDDFIKKNPVFTGDFNELRGDILSSDREIAAFAFALAENGVIEQFVTPVQEKEEDRTVFNLKGNDNEIADLTEHLELNGYKFDISKESFYDVSYLSVLADDEAYIKTILDDRNIDYTIQPKDLVIDIPEYGFKVDLKDSTIKLNTVSYEKRDGIDVKKVEDDVFFEFKAGEIRTEYYDRVNSMPIDISIDLDEAKEIVKKFLDEALNDRNKTVYIVNEMSDEIAFIPPATETENIPQNNTPDRDSIKVGDMFYYRGGECEVYELSGQTENDITITYDNDTIDFPQPIYENINRDTLLQEGKYLGNALDKAESQIDAQKASTSVQAAPEAENVSHNENDFSEEINGYDNSTKYVIKSTDNADNPCNVQIMTSIDNGETYNYAGRGQFCTSLDEARAFINGDIADKLVVGDIIELGGEKLKITEIDSDFRMGFENTDKTAPIQVRSFIGHWKKNLLNELGDKPLVVEKDLSEQEKIIDSAEPIKEPAPEAEIKHINAADITLGDTFIYKNTEYTVTAMYGVYPDDIGISKKDGNFVITENVDKFKLAAEGNYLGNPDRVAENFKITDTELGVGTPREKFRANIEAIKTLKELERLNVPATKEQQEILSKYVGWGGLSEAFDTDPSKGWSKEYTELKELLTDSEYESARSSVTDAFYTSPEIIKAMYSTLEKMGFEGGKILEPAMGIGNFFGAMPENIEKNSTLYGVELDDISGRIAKQLYPDAKIQIRGLEKTNFQSDIFDLAVGNVPFGQVRLSDKTFKKGELIHDYFFKKALDKVHAGGVVAFITSSGTLDKKDSSVRKYLAERADLLGAVRLPNTAFKSNAGTEVVSDILFLQKRSEPRDLTQDMPEWVNASEIDDSLYTEKARESGETIRINDYFKSHPEAVAGDIKVVSNAYGFGITCDAKENETLAESINAALETVSGKIENVSHNENIFDRDISAEKTNEIDPSKYPNFCLSVIDGEVYYRENDTMEKQTFKRSSDEVKTIELISIAETLKTLIEEQSRFGTPDSRIADLQAELNIKYDDFTKQHGLIDKSINLLAKDDRKNIVKSLEFIDNDGKLERKADIFTKRTVSVPAPVEKVDTPAEALVVSLGEKARVDIEFMAKLCNQSEEYVISSLQADGQIFKNPETEQYETRDEYLSGNVRKKLETAIESSVADESYKINVDALKTVQPIDLTSDEIMAQLGSTWIPTKYFEQFIYELLETPTYSRADYEYKSNDDPFAARGRNWATIAVAYDPTTATYGISNKNVMGKDDVPSRSTYGTARKSAYELIEACLNQTLVTVYDKDPITEKRYVNKEATAEAQAKQEMIKDMFADWIYADEDRANDLVQIYNEKFNSVVPREYDGSSLVLSGINSNIKLRQHQKDAIARILYSNKNALIAHEVGAGKTFTLQAAGMEGKRLGLFHKSLYAVPKAILNQFAKEFLELYPSANILVATEKDFEKANRQSFFAKAVTGEYDAIVMSHEQFKKIPMSQEYQENYIRKEIDGITSELDKIKREDKGRGFSVKQLETKKKQLERKLTTLINSDDKDRALTFEELGIDKIFVDEAHAYKNLFFSTKMGRNVAGINAGVESQRATDMYMKCRYLDEITGSKGTVFSTGTPISNGIAEMYTMQKYLQNDVLRANGLENFDAWAANFGKIEAGMELTPESTGFQQKIRFSQFDNVPELTTMFKETADIKTADVLNIPNMPTPEFKVIDTPASPEQKEMIQGLAERANDVRNKRVDPTEDNMLRITNDGRKLALDQRLLDPTLPDDPNSKVNLCIANVAKIWEESKDYKGTQIIFCDLSTPKNNGEFSVYRDIESKLSEQYGIPKEQILAIHDVSDKKKAEVMRKVNEGEIRILLGSTSKLGTGVNCQRLLKAVHHLDCPWKPADLQQRNGRIIRQGNLNKNVNIFNYVTSGTFDGYSYQLVENKQKSIAQIMTSKTPERSVQDVDDSVLSFAEIKALAMDNPLLREQMMLDISLKKLETNYNSFCRGQNALKNKLNKDFPLTIEKAKHDIEKLSKDVETAEKHKNSDNKFAGIEIQGKTYTERAEAEKALLAACRTIKPYYGCGTKDVEIGCYKGFDLKAYYSSVSNHYVLKVQGADEYKVELGTVDGVRNIQRVDHLLGSTLKKELASAQYKVESTQLKIQQAEKQLSRTFPQLKELEEKREKLKEINDKIAAQQEPPEPPKKGDDCL